MAWGETDTIVTPAKSNWGQNDPIVDPNQLPIENPYEETENAQQAIDRSSVAFNLAKENNLSYGEGQQLIAGDEPSKFMSAFGKIKDYINEKTFYNIGYQKPANEPVYREEQPFKTIGQFAARTTAEVVSGLSMTTADVLTNKITGDKTLAEFVDRVSGFKPTPQEVEAGTGAKYIGAFTTAGKGVGLAVSKIPAATALKTLLESGLTFGTVEAAIQFSKNVTEGTPVDWREIHLASATGVLWGIGEVAVSAAVSGLAKGYEKYWGSREIELAKSGLTGRTLQEQEVIQKAEKIRDIQRAKTSIREGNGVPPDLREKYIAPPKMEATTKSTGNASKAPDVPVKPQPIEEMVFGKGLPVDATQVNVDVSKNKFLYHNTSQRYFDDIKKSGLILPEEGGYPHGEKTISDDVPRIYLSENKKRALQFGGMINSNIPELKSLLLRVRKDAISGNLHKPESLSGTGEVWLFDNGVSPEYIEYFDNGKWKPITGKLKEIITQQTPPSNVGGKVEAVTTPIEPEPPIKIEAEVPAGETIQWDKVVNNNEGGVSKTTSARQADVDLDRKSLGLDSMASPERKSWQESLAEARAKGIPAQASAIAAKINLNPRALEDYETAGLVIRSAELKRQHKEVMAEIGKSTDKADIIGLNAQLGQIEDEFNSLTSAIYQSGSVKGRNLAAQKLTINEDYDLVSVKNRAKSMKGKELTTKESEKLTEITTKLDESNAKIDELSRQVAELQANTNVKKAGLRRYKDMGIVAKDLELNALVERTRGLLKEGCYN